MEHQTCQMDEQMGSLSLSSGDLGDRWRYGHVTVQSYSSFQVAFEGTVGNSVQVRFQYHNVPIFEI